jgi:AraC-like DNA-binding protein
MLELPSEQHVLQGGLGWWLIDLTQARRYIPADGTRLVTMGVRFGGPGIDAWREALGGRSGVCFASTRQSVQLRRATDELKHLAARPAADAEWRMHELVINILGVLYHRMEPRITKTAAVPAPVRSVIEAVQADPIRAWRPSELSALAGVSYSSLRNHFKQSHGETIHDFLRSTRLEQARWRLADPRQTVKEISSQLNFSSEFYFSRWFRQATGVCPTRFRAMLRG